jgi:hypothetical protein
VGAEAVLVLAMMAEVVEAKVTEVVINHFHVKKFMTKWKNTF